MQIVKKLLSLLFGIIIILSVSVASVLAIEYTKDVRVQISNSSSSAYTNIYDVNGDIKKRLITIRVEKGESKNNPRPYYYTWGLIAFGWPDQKYEVKASGNISSHYADVWDGVRSMGISGTLSGSITKKYTVTNYEYE